MPRRNRRRRLGQWGRGSDGNFGMHSFQNIYWNSETVTFLSFSTISARRALVNFWLKYGNGMLTASLLLRNLFVLFGKKPAAAHLRLPPYEYRLTLQNFKKKSKLFANT